MAEMRRGWRTSEVAALMKVDPKTVSAWVRRGRLEAFRTPGGHLRIANSEVLRLFEELGQRKHETAH